MGLIAKRDDLKAKIKALEKKLGFKMKGGIIKSKEGNKSPEKKGATRAKGGDHKDEGKYQGKTSQNSTQYNKNQDNGECWKLTPELIKQVMDRSRKNIFKLRPDNFVDCMEHMIMKAVSAYEKEITKRK